jgi:hypothetical protein
VERVDRRSGGGFRSCLQADLDALVRTAEADVAALVTALASLVG